METRLIVYANNFRLSMFSWKLPEHSVCERKAEPHTTDYITYTCPIFRLQMEKLIWQLANGCRSTLA